jgi:hypothetical protein
MQIGCKHSASRYPSTAGHFCAKGRDFKIPALSTADEVIGHLEYCQDANFSIADAIANSLKIDSRPEKLSPLSAHPRVQPTRVQPLPRL